MKNLHNNQLTALAMALVSVIAVVAMTLLSLTANAQTYRVNSSGFITKVYEHPPDADLVLKYMVDARLNDLTIREDLAEARQQQARNIVYALAGVVVAGVANNNGNDAVAIAIGGTIGIVGLVDNLKTLRNRRKLLNNLEL